MADLHLINNYFLFNLVYTYQDLLKQKQSGGGGALRNIIYGCSELLSGDDFLKQLERLGATSAAR